MNTPDDGWIAFALQRPEPSQPYWYCCAGSSKTYYCSGAEETRGGMFTHWQPANIPAPPRREPTQAEVDDEMIRLYLCDPRHDPLGMSDGMHAALAWERGQIRELLKEATRDRDITIPEYRRQIVADPEVFARLAARVGLTP